MFKKRFQGADIAAIILSALVVLGSLMPWGDPDAGAFDHGQAITTLLLGAAALVIFIFVPAPHGRKWPGLLLGILTVSLCWGAINAINETTETDDPITYFTGESMQAGLWITLLAGFALSIASLAVRTRERKWAPVPELDGPAPPAYEEPEPAPPPTLAPHWAAAPVTAVGHSRRMKCPQCATTFTASPASPACPNCGLPAQGP